MTGIRTSAVCGAIAAALVGTALAAAVSRSGATGARELRAAPQRHAARPAGAALPLWFEEDGSGGVTARAAGYALHLDGAGATVAARGGAPVRMRFESAAGGRVARGASPLRARANYFLGADPAAWRTNVPTFAEALCEGVWPGIDVVCRASGGDVEYDFRVAPRADPSRIVLAFEGADSLSVAPDGDLVVAAGGREFRHRRPVAWQEDGARRIPVEGSFRLLGGGRVGFRTSALDPCLALVIDPVVTYASYFSDAGEGRACGADAEGNVWIAGFTSATIPVLGGFQSSNDAGTTTYVAKFDADGELVWSSYLGGGDRDELYDLATDGSGNVVVCGQTLSADFPTQSAHQGSYAGSGDGFATKIAANGASLLWSTYLGGTGIDGSDVSVAVDSSARTFVALDAGAGFPTSGGVVAPTGSGVAVVRLESSGTRAYSTFVNPAVAPATENFISVAASAAGECFVCARTTSATFPTSGGAFRTTAPGGSADGVVVKLSADGTSRVWATYLGGGGSERPEGIAVDSAGDVYVTTQSDSSDFPTVPASPRPNANGSITITRIAADGASLVWSRWLGGSVGDNVRDLALDSAGRLFLVGTSSSADFPVQDPFDAARTGSSEGVMARLAAADGSTQWSSYNGIDGNSDPRAVAANGAGGAVFICQTQTGVATPGAYQTASGVESDSPFFVVVDGASGAPLPPAPAATEGFFLPKKVQLKLAGGESTFVAAGFFDTGPDGVDLTQAATLDVGGLHFDFDGLAPDAKGLQFGRKDPGVEFFIRPQKSGSSRAKFKLKLTGDLAGGLALDGPVSLEFENGDVDGVGTVVLQSGAYKLGRAKGLLVAPAVFPYKAVAKVVGDGEDTFTILAGFAGDGSVPAQAEDVTVFFGAADAVRIRGSEFVRNGDSYVFKGDQDGIAGVTVDYLRERILVKAKGVDLGAVPEGAQPLYFGVVLGSTGRAVDVRAVRSGTKLKY